ncbi:hypothetical protein ARC310_18540 [Pantoea ananatis]|nr:hypothetical protein ARC310_18540 [Pantoea ananatis]PZD69247.1 hypothetical protein ARC311_04815 [Pantoea ananatis]
MPAKVIDVPASSPVIQEKKQKESEIRCCVAALLRCCVAALLRKSLRRWTEEKQVCCLSGCSIRNVFPPVTLNTLTFLKGQKGEYANAFVL